MQTFNGVVTLTGDVPPYAGRWAAEDIAKRVTGVRAIANDIQIAIPAASGRTDTDIAEATANALRWNVSLSGTDLKPMVKDGWVSLSGQVNWGYQRAAAAHQQTRWPWRGRGWQRPSDEP